MSQPSANDLYKAAIRLAKQGQPVFPCKSSGAKAKAPLTKNGLLDATTDPAQIKAWWRKYGPAAIGIATGHVWDVLDVDVKHEVDGRVHLPMLNRLGLLDGCQRIARTPSGGWHLYFKAVPGGLLRNKAVQSLGLDVRSMGGYVLAPPSYLIDAETSEGESYSGPYVDEGAPEGSNDDPLLWEQIRSALQPMDEETKKPVALLPSERRTSLAALREWVSNLRPGERNNGLHWAVCRCIDNGLDPHELIEPAMVAGLDEDEILLTVRSALRRAGVNPKDLQSEAEAMFS